MLDVSHKVLRTYREGITTVDMSLPATKLGLNCQEFETIRVVVYPDSGDLTNVRIRPAFWSPNLGAFVPAPAMEITGIADSGDAFDLQVAHAEAVFLQVTDLQLGTANEIAIDVQGVPKYDALG